MPAAIAMVVGVESRLSSRLSSEQLVDRLRIRSGPLVETLYDIASQQMAMEERRQAGLDGKAQGLLTAAGLSNTVAFTFGGVLLQHPECLRSGGSGLLWVVILVYAGALMCGLAAGATALRALWIKDDFEKLDEDDYLHRHELQEADRAADGDALAGMTRYKRYLIVNLIKLHRARDHIHEKKARMVRNGQMCFGLFLAGIMIIGAAITTATLSRARVVEGVRAPGPDREDPRGPTRPAEEAEPPSDRWLTGEPPSRCDRTDPPRSALRSRAASEAFLVR